MLKSWIKLISFLHQVELNNMLFFVDMGLLMGLVGGIALSAFIPSIPGWIREKMFHKCDK